MRYLALFILGLSITACYYDSEEYLFPQLNAACDTAQVGFAASVQPVLNSYCYSCHSNINAADRGGNISLEDYADVKIRVDNGSLMGSINHESAYPPMPLGGGKLDNCSLVILRIWTEGGAPNN